MKSKKSKLCNDKKIVASKSAGITKSSCVYCLVRRRSTDDLRLPENSSGAVC